MMRMRIGINIINIIVSIIISIIINIITIINIVVIIIVIIIIIITLNGRTSTSVFGTLPFSDVVEENVSVSSGILGKQ